mgnify:CR=1 FL=1
MSNIITHTIFVPTEKAGAIRGFVKTEDYDFDLSTYESHGAHNGEHIERGWKTVEIGGSVFEYTAFQTNGGLVDGNFAELSAQFPTTPIVWAYHDEGGYLTFVTLFLRGRNVCEVKIPGSVAVGLCLYDEVPAIAEQNPEVLGVFFQAANDLKAQLAPFSLDVLKRAIEHLEDSAIAAIEIRAALAASDSATANIWHKDSDDGEIRWFTIAGDIELSAVSPSDAFKVCSRAADYIREKLPESDRANRVSIEIQWGY